MFFVNFVKMKEKKDKKIKKEKVKLLLEQYNPILFKFHIFFVFFLNAIDILLFLPGTMFLSLNNCIPFDNNSFIFSITIFFFLTFNIYDSGGVLLLPQGCVCCCFPPFRFFFLLLPLPPCPPLMVGVHRKIASVTPFWREVRP